MILSCTNQIWFDLFGCGVHINRCQRIAYTNMVGESALINSLNGNSWKTFCTKANAPWRRLPWIRSYKDLLARSMRFNKTKYSLSYFSMFPFWFSIFPNYCWGRHTWLIPLISEKLPLFQQRITYSYVLLEQLLNFNMKLLDTWVNSASFYCCRFSTPPCSCVLFPTVERSLWCSVAPRLFPAIPFI